MIKLLFMQNFNISRAAKWFIVCKVSCHLETKGLSLIKLFKQILKC